MKLQLFQGGLNTRVAPELINASQSVVNLNVDMSTGQLVPVNGLSSEVDYTADYPYYWQVGGEYMPKADTRDYLPYQGDLFWTELGGVPSKYIDGVTSPLGLEAPANWLEADLVGVITSVSDEDTDNYTFVPSVYGVTLGIDDGVDQIEYDTVFGVAESTQSVVSVLLSLPPPSIEVYENTFDSLPEVKAISGDFPGGTETWYVLLHDENGLIFFDEAEIDTTSSSGAELTASGRYPNFMEVKFARIYEGTLFDVPSTDTVYDISGNTTTDLTLSQQLYREGTILAVQGAITSEGYTGSLSETVYHKIGEGEVWMEVVLEETEGTKGASRGEDTFIGRRRIPTDDITSLYVGPEVFWEDSGLTGTIQYVYTYYDVVDGTESQPSHLSTEVEVYHGYLSYSVIASDSPNVTHIKVYRIGGGLLDFTEIAEHPNRTADYLDLQSGLTATGGTLATELNGVPPEGLRFLRESHGVFFGALGPKLYFTKSAGNPNYWPEPYYIDIHEDITAIGVIAGGLIVFTRYSSFLISGTSSTTFVKYTISNDQGCIDHKSVVLKAGSALFLSTDGLCTVNTNDVVVISKVLLGEVLFAPRIALLYNEVYYCQLEDGSIFVYDMRYERAFHYYDFDTSWLVKKDDCLLAVKDGEVRECFEGEPSSYAFLTGNLTEGANTHLKLYDEIYVYVAKGEVKLSVSIDSILVGTFELEAAPKPIRIAVPQENQRGSSIQFLVEGTGVVREIEYKVGGRANGK